MRFFVLSTLYCLSATTLLLPATAFGQAATDTFTEVVNVEVVNLEVFVTTKKGEPILGLAKEDFEMKVDGKPIPISNFYAEVQGEPILVSAPTPGAPEPNLLAPRELRRAAEQRLHLMVFIDVPNIRGPNRKRIFGPLKDLLRENLQPEDRATLVTMQEQARIHTPFLTVGEDLGTLFAILDDLESVTHGKGREDEERENIFRELGRRHTRGDGYAAGDIWARIRVYAESIYSRNKVTLKTLQRFVQAFSGVRGRKAMVLVTDGIPNRPGEDLLAAAGSDYYEERIGRFDLIPDFTEVARLANLGGITFHVLESEPDHGEAIRGANLDGSVAGAALSVAVRNHRDMGESIAVATGGRRIQASTRLVKDLAMLGGDFGTYYSLGFQRDAIGEEPGSYSVDVQVRQKGAVVRHRKALTTPPADRQMAGELVAAQIFGAVSDPLGVEVKLDALQAGDDGQARLPVHLKIPTAPLGAAPDAKGALNARVSIFFSFQENEGQAGRIAKQTHPVPLQEDAEHLDLPILLPAPEEARKLAIGILDEVTGAHGSVLVKL